MEFGGYAGQSPNKMTINEIKRRFPKASDAFIRANLSADVAAPSAIVECHPSHEPLATEEIQGSTGKGFFVRVTSYRSRLLDEDNLCEKYLVDLLRYCGVLPDDAPGVCKIEVGQTKTRKGEQEKTVIEVRENL